MTKSFFFEKYREDWCSVECTLWNTISIYKPSKFILIHKIQTNCLTCPTRTSMVSPHPHHLSPTDCICSCMHTFFSGPGKLYIDPKSYILSCLARTALSTWNVFPFFVYLVNSSLSFEIRYKQHLLCKTFPDPHNSQSLSSLYPLVIICLVVLIAFY